MGIIKTGSSDHVYRYGKLMFMNSHVVVILARSLPALTNLSEMLL